MRGIAMLVGCMKMARLPAGEIQRTRREVNASFP